MRGSPSSVTQLKCPECTASSSALDFLNPVPSKAGEVAPSAWTVKQLQLKLNQIDAVRSELLALLSAAGVPTGMTSEDSSAVSADSSATSLSRSVSGTDVRLIGDAASSVGDYHLSRLDENGQRALQLLTTHDNIAFKVAGVCFLSERDSDNVAAVDVKMKEFSKRYSGQEFTVSIQCLRRVFAVSSRPAKSTRDAAGNQYRQERAFSTINSAQFDSVDGSKLRVTFKNGRGFFVLKFTSSIESTMIMSICNIIAQNEDYRKDLDKGKQLIWAGYVQKKGKRMGWSSHRFLALRSNPYNLEMYRSHTNYTNGEEPSFRTSLMKCDFSEKRADAKEVRIQVSADTNLILRLASVVERDDFLNLCASSVMIAARELKAAKGAGAAGVGGGGASGAAGAGSSSSSLVPIGGDIELSVSGTTQGAFPGEGSSVKSRRIPGTGMVVDSDDSDDEKSGREDSYTGSGIDLMDEEYGSPSAITPGMPGLTTHASIHAESFFDSAKSLMLVSDDIVEKRSAKHWRYMEMLSHTPRMYGASHTKALDRLAKRRASDVDFIEETFGVGSGSVSVASGAPLARRGRMSIGSGPAPVKGAVSVPLRAESSPSVPMKSGFYMLIPQPSKFLQTFALMHCLAQSMIAGAFLNEEIYIPKQVWLQNRVLLVNYDEKLEVLNRMSEAMNDLLSGDVSLEWLSAENWKKNSQLFHERLVKCEKQLNESNLILQTYVDKTVKKQKKKGFGKLFNSIKDKSTGKVYDNSEYRDKIQIICQCSCQLETLYRAMIDPSCTAGESSRIAVDLEKVSTSLKTFTQVVYSDLKEFMKSYLKRGAKNLYQ